MFALVLFTDDILFICNTESISVTKNKCSVKYTNKKRYEARVLAICSDKNFLTDIKENAERSSDFGTVEYRYIENEEAKYDEAVQNILKNEESNIVYVEKNIVQLERMGNCVKSFSIESLNEGDLWDKPTCFMKLQKVHLTERTEKLGAQRTSRKIKSTATNKTKGNSRVTRKNGHPNCEDEISTQQLITPAKIEEQKIALTNNINENNGTQYENENGNQNNNKNFILHSNLYSEKISEHDSLPQKKTSVNKAAIKKNSLGMEKEKSTEIYVKMEDVKEVKTSCTQPKVNTITNESRGMSMNYNEPDGKKSSTETTEPNFNDTYTINLSNIELTTTKFDVFQYEENLPVFDFDETSFELKNDLNGNDIVIMNDTSEPRTNNGNVNVGICKPRIIEDKIFDIPISIIPFDSNATAESEYKLTNFNHVFHPLKVDDNGNDLNTIKNLEPEDKIEELGIDTVFNDNVLPMGHSTIDEFQLPMMSDAKNQDTFFELLNTETARTIENDQVSGLDSDDTINDKNYQPDHDILTSDDSLSNDDDRIFEKSERNNSSSLPPLHISLGLNTYQASALDDRELMVENSDTSQSKKHFCIYCKKLQTKIARHLQTVHSCEEDVKKFILLPPGSRERQEIIASIRKNGDHVYNTDRKVNTGKLLVCRRPNERMKKTAEDFLSCGNCKGQYARSVIRHHWRLCTKRDGKRERIVIIKGRKVAARLHEKASVDVRKHIFPYMREDEIVRAIRYDELIILYANKQCQKYCSHQHQYQMIRARLRLLGRFFDAIKKVDNRIKQFADLFQPRYYDCAITAVRIVAKFNPEKRVFEHPAVASNLGTILKQAGEVLRSEYIKRELEHDQKRVDDFLKLLVEDYGVSINKIVAETQTQNNRRKKTVLPTTDDIKKLHTFLKSERTKYFQLLQQNYSYEAWRKLAETTLLSLQLFNRRRPGEIERLYLDDFNSYQGIEMADKESYNALSEEGKKLARDYVRFEIRGKLGRGVPVLIYTDILNCLKLIIQHRTNANVPRENEYLFGLPSNDKDRFRYLRACDLMRDYSRECGAEIPESLRGTKLRKHIATKCIHLNLTHGQVTDLANFLGHHEKIHKDIYRQPVLETDIIKMTKILKTAQGLDGNSSDESDNSEMEISIENSHKCSETSIRVPQRTIGKPSTTRRWSNLERNVVLSAFQHDLDIGRFPSGLELQKIIDTQDCLKGRTVPQLRTWLHMQKKKNMKN